jgi:hypothetical protein
VWGRRRDVKLQQLLKVKGGGAMRSRPGSDVGGRWSAQTEEVMGALTGGPHYSFGRRGQPV